LIGGIVHHGGASSLSQECTIPILNYDVKSGAIGSI
jgi:hypothetical protein